MSLTQDIISLPKTIHASYLRSDNRFVFFMRAGIALAVILTFIGVIVGAYQLQGQQTQSSTVQAEQSQTSAEKTVGLDGTISSIQEAQLTLKLDSGQITKVSVNSGTMVYRRLPTPEGAAPLQPQLTEKSALKVGQQITLLAYYQGADFQNSTAKRIIVNN